MHLFSFAALVAMLCLQAKPVAAQEADDHKYEVGIRFSSLYFNGANAFSAIYKKKLDNGKYRRISGTFGGINFGSEFRRYNFSLNAGITVGAEKRRQVGKRTSYYTGPSFIFNGGFSKQENVESNWNLQPGLGYVVGLQYEFNEFWAVNLETMPSGTLSLRQFTGTDVGVNASLGFSSNVTLSLMHKF